MQRSDNSSNDEGSASSLYRHLDVKQRFEIDNYIIKELGMGCEARLFAFVPKQVANEILSDYSAEKLSKDGACKKLQAALQAAKITHVSHANDCRTEIEALRNLDEGYSHIVKMTDSDDAEHGWLTIELLAKTLDSFITKTKARKTRKNANVLVPPLSFGWHLIHQLTEAFLELHFGMISGTNVPSSARYAHNDVLAQNLMFRSPGKYGYPDLVIIDLGKAERVGDTDAGQRGYIYKAQARDVVEAASTMKPLLDSISKGSELSVALQKLLNCYTGQRLESDGNEQLRKLLIALRDKAFQRRKQLYKELQPELSRYFDEKIVGDDELLAELVQLRASGSRSGSSLESAAESTPSPPKQRGLSKRHRYMLQHRERDTKLMRPQRA